MYYSLGFFIYSFTMFIARIPQNLNKQNETLDFVDLFVLYIAIKVNKVNK